MSEDTPTYHAEGDAAIEARIVALVLGEASAFEAEEIKRLCAERPELEIFRRRIAAVHQLLGIAENPAQVAGWRLSPDKRAALDNVLGAPAPPAPTLISARKPRRVRRLWLPAAACALLLAAIGGLVAPMAMREGSMKLTETNAAHSERMSRSRAQSAAANPASPSPIPVPETQPAEPALALGAADSFGAGWGDAAGLTPDADRRPASPSSAVAGAIAPAPARSARADAPVRSNPASTTEHNAAVDEVRRGLYTAEGNYNLGNFDDAKKEFENVLRTDPHNAAARRGMERIAAAKSDYYRAAYDNTRAELLTQVDSAWELADSGERASNLGEAPSEKSDLSTLSTQDAQALRDLEASVDARRRELATIVRTKGIIHAGDDSFYGAADTGARTAQSTYNQLEQEMVRIETQIESLLRYEDEQLITYAAGLNLPGNPVRELAPKYLELQSQAAKLKSEQSDGSPGALAEVQEQLSGIRKEMDEAVLNLRATLRAQLDLASERFDRVASLRNETSDEAIQRGLHAQDYLDARAAFENEQRRLQEMRARLLESSRPASPAPAAPENETSAAADPFSTFSLNVSDASFVLARDALRRGERPAPAQIHVEQFYNAFDYGDPAPSPGEAVATRIEQAAHPLLPGRNLLRIAARVGGTGRAASQPLHLTLLVDQSGSMVRADRRAALDIALQTLAGLLNENDRINLIGFARTPRLIAEAMPGTRAAELPRLVHIAAAEGGTNLEGALDLAGEITARHLNPAAQNRIVILSDGAVNLGAADPARLADHIARLRQQGIATDIAGIGSDGLNDALLAELARHGDGRFHIVTPETGESLARDLAGAFRPAARDVKVQVVFNPERVGGWRLIGFDQHLLRTEDFRNDAIDAAELAENEAATAIYQVEILADGHGELGEFFIRFQDAASGRIVERSWPIPYQPNAPAADQAAPSMQLATLAMLTAEQLRGTPLAAAATPETTRPLIQNVTTHFRDNPRARELLEIQSHIAQP